MIIRAQYSPCDQEERRSPDYLLCVRVTRGVLASHLTAVIPPRCLPMGCTLVSHRSKEETHTGLEGNRDSQQGLLTVNLLSTTSGGGRVESSLILHCAVRVGASALVILYINYHGLCYNSSVLINAFFFSESIKAKLFGAKNLSQLLSSQEHFCGFANPVG